MAKQEKSKLRQMIEEYGIKDMNDVHEFVKMLTAETIQAALDAELENDLGYSKYDDKNKQTDNSRNGYSRKTVQSSTGEMEIKVPRDRQGEYEPQLVKKHQTDVSSIEDKIIFLYSQGISTHDIQKTMQEMYGIDVDDSRISKITDKSCRRSRNGRADLKPVYKAPTEETALTALVEFEAKWGGKYPLAVKFWRVNWNELSTMFKYPPEIRKLIYTTNTIENFNRQLRKVTKTKSAFVSDDALMKILYLTTMSIGTSGRCRSRTGAPSWIIS